MTRKRSKVTGVMGVVWLALPLVVASCGVKQVNGAGGRSGNKDGVNESSMRGVVKGQRAIGRVEVLTWVIDDGLTQTAAVGAGVGKAQPGPDESVAAGKLERESGSGGTGARTSAKTGASVREAGTLPLEAALAEAKAVPWPLSAQSTAILNANGIVAMAVPLEQLDALQTRLRIAGPLRQQFFAQSPRWTEVYRGPMADGVHPIQLVGIGGTPDEMSTVDISRGNFRLLLRNWLAPGEMVVTQSQGAETKPQVGSEGAQEQKQGPEEKEGESPMVATGVSAVMRVDLVPQHYDRAALSAREQDGFTPQRAPTVGELGVTIEPLLIEVTLKGDAALVLFPTGQTLVQTSDSKDGSGEAVGGQERSKPFGLLGPDIPELPLLGSAMFSDALVGGPGRARAVLIVIPTLPEFFGGL